MALQISSGSSKKKLTDEERQALGGSVWDQMYFSDDDLINVDKVRQEARAGNITWGDANKYANSIREGYGYNGGARGDEYNKVPGYIQALNIDMPEYNSRYDPAISEGVEKLLSRPAFSYDPYSDPRYSAYKKEYTREGQRAAADVMGQYAAMTGGMPSTAAIAASQQAGDYYAAQMADKIPELYQLAYQMYMQEGDEMRANLNMLRGLEGDDWGRYTDRWNMADADRRFDYGVQSDNWNRSHTLDREAEDDRRYQTEWDYKVAQDQKEWDLNTALQAAQYGDYSGLQALGINPDLNAVLQFALASGGRTTPIGSGGGGGGGGGSRSSSPSLESMAEEAAGNKWASVEEWRNRYGDDAVESYIAEHYKDLGYSSASAAQAGWKNHITESGSRLMSDGDKDAYLSDLYNNSIMDTGIALYGDPTVTNQHTKDMIVIDGVTYPRSQLEALIDSGEVREVYNQQNNTVTYERVKRGGLSQR